MFDVLSCLILAAFDKSAVRCHDLQGSAAAATPFCTELAADASLEAQFNF